MSHDQFFTPPELSSILVSSISLRRVARIADFAAGHGELLSSALRRFPKCNAIACDIDLRCVREMKRRNPLWKSVRIDFLDPTAREKAEVIRESVSKCCCVLLNPPFSGKGGKRVSLMIAERAISCSRAMAFVLLSIEYLRKGGELVSILPISCLTSIKDRASMSYLQSRGTVEVVRQLPKGVFQGCAAKTAVIKFREGKQSQLLTATGRHNHRHSNKLIDCILTRGSLPVYRAKEIKCTEGMRFIHTRDMRLNAVCAGDQYVASGTRVIKGPSVLIPRVGLPTSNKCCLYLTSQEAVLSDCVICLTCKSRRDAIRMHTLLLMNWDRIAARYGGTGAPYITISDLSETLAELGVQVSRS